MLICSVIGQVSAGWINEAFLQIKHTSENKNGKENKNNGNSQLVYDHFGWAVSLHLSTLVVGAYGDSTAGTSAGAAYVFDRYNHDIYGWSCSQQLLPAKGNDYDAFGWSVSLFNNITAIGAYGYSTDEAVFSGAVYVFQRIGKSAMSNEENGRLQSWTQTSLLLPSDAHNNDFFGWDVALWNNLLAIGSHDWASEDTDEAPMGAVYTYSTGGLDMTDTPITQIHYWYLDQKMSSEDPSSRYFGNRISMSENNLLVGSFGDEYSVADNVGQAFLYTAMETKVLISEAVDGDETSSYDTQQLYTWTSAATLVPNTTEIGIDFGFSVDIDDVTAVVGAIRADGQAIDSGAVFVFIRTNTKFEYPMSERTYLALVSFLPIFFLTVFCIIGSTMACMKWKTNSPCLTLLEDFQEDGEDEEFDDEEMSEYYDSSAHSTMDSSVYSVTELISSGTRYTQQH
jgi:hypothetical protein